MEINGIIRSTELYGRSSISKEKSDAVQGPRGVRAVTGHGGTPTDTGAPPERRRERGKTPAGATAGCAERWIEDEETMVPAG